MIKQLPDKLSALRAAARQGKRFIIEMGVMPQTETELEYLLDEAFVRDETYWYDLIDAAGQEGVDAAFYAGAYLEWMEQRMSGDEREAV